MLRSSSPHAIILPSLRHDGMGGNVIVEHLTAEDRSKEWPVPGKEAEQVKSHLVIL